MSNTALLLAISENRMSGVCHALIAGADNYKCALKVAFGKNTDFGVNCAMYIMYAASNRARGEPMKPMKLDILASDLDFTTTFMLIFAAELGTWVPFLERTGMGERVESCFDIIKSAWLYSGRDDSAAFMRKFKAQPATTLIVLLIWLIEHEHWYRVRDVARVITPEYIEWTMQQVAAHIPNSELWDMFMMVMQEDPAWKPYIHEKECHASRRTSTSEFYQTPSRDALFASPPQ